MALLKRLHISKTVLIIGLVVLGIAATVVLQIVLVRKQPPAQRSGVTYRGSASYVGGQSCIACHDQEHADWHGSHHDWAMREVSDQTVLGDFDDTSFTHFGVTSRFFKRDGKYFVHTDGPDGELADFEIAYTFGVEPLQQYLIAFPGGRLQALNIAWDTRPLEQGGQRWFHLRPDERVPHTDTLHWTAPSQNWNHMCAQCHSTNLVKQYDEPTRSFDTVWSEINVSCEACHGPGSHHVQWAALSPTRRAADPGYGLTAHLKQDGRVWVMDPETGIAQRQTPLTDRAQSETCAVCHSRRGQLTETYQPGRPIGDSHQVSLLEPGLYHPDGQILDEVYVYGSFRQSKMYHAGVTCTDCHNPHSTRVHAPGNALCAQCHMPERFDTPAHHHHEAGSAGASCLDCHMPHQTYMVVDDRRDHSFRIPRPDLSLKLGTPNACTQCHDDQTDQWASDAVTRWYGPREDTPPHYGEVFASARAGRTGSDAWLMWLTRQDQPAIVRATAISMLAGNPSPDAAQITRDGLEDPDPLVREAAVGTLMGWAPPDRVAALLPMLDDEVRSVRLQAGRVFSLTPDTALATRSSEQRDKVRRAIADYLDAQRVAADQPGTQMQMGIEAFHRARLTPPTGPLAQQYAQAEAHFREAIALEPAFLPAYPYLLAILRDTGRADEADALLSREIARQQAVLDSPPGESTAGDYATLANLAQLHMLAGNRSAARTFAQRMTDLRPNDPQAQQFLRELGP